MAGKSVRLNRALAADAGSSGSLSGVKWKYSTRGKTLRKLLNDDPQSHQLQHQYKGKKSLRGYDGDENDDDVDISSSQFTESDFDFLDIDELKILEGTLDLNKKKGNKNSLNNMNMIKNTNSGLSSLSDFELDPSSPNSAKGEKQAFHFSLSVDEKVDGTNTSTINSNSNSIIRKNKRPYSQPQSSKTSNAKPKSSQSKENKRHVSPKPRSTTPTTPTSPLSFPDPTTTSTTTATDNYSDKRNANPLGASSLVPQVSISGPEDAKNRARTRFRNALLSISSLGGSSESAQMRQIKRSRSIINFGRQAHEVIEQEFAQKVQSNQQSSRRPGLIDLSCVQELTNIPIELLSSLHHKPIPENIHKTKEKNPQWRQNVIEPRKSKYSSSASGAVKDGESSGNETNNNNNNWNANDDNKQHWDWESCEKLENVDNLYSSKMFKQYIVNQNGHMPHFLE